MKFSGKMCLMTILKVTKNQGRYNREDTIFEKLEGGIKLTPSQPVLGLRQHFLYISTILKHRTF